MRRRPTARSEQDRLLQELREFAEKLGGRVTIADFRRTHNNGFYASLLRCFGSIGAAREKAGIATASQPYKWPRDRIIAALWDAHRNGIRLTGPSLKRAGKAGLLSAAEQRFGGLPRARAAAGLVAPPFVRAKAEEWTATRVVLMIQERHRSGESLASSKIPASLRTAARVYWGSWRQAVEAAGFDYASVRLVRERYSRSELIAELTKLARSAPAMTVTALHRTGLYQRCLDEFSTLAEAIREAGIQNWPRRSRLPLLSREQVVERLQQLRQAGQDLRRSSVRRLDPHLARSIDRNFDSWAEAFVLAGL